MTTELGIDPNICKDVSHKITSLLANEYVLYLKTLNFHWNITGEMFFSLHLLLEKHYEWLKDVIDMLAERIRALGHIAPSAYKKYYQAATIEDAKENQTAYSMITELVASHSKVIQQIRNDIGYLESTKDYATQDMLIKLLGEHEKNIWILRSHLINKPEVAS